MSATQKQQYKKPLDTIHSYVKLGWPVIPLCPCNHSSVGAAHKNTCKTPGKVPLLSGWQKRGVPTDIEIAQWKKNWPWANIGLLTGEPSGLVGVDVDGDAGERLLAEWSKGDLPETWEFRRGDKSRRLLYRIPPGIKLKKYSQAERKKEHEELALLGTGQQTVIPPSIHASGDVYQWAPGKDPWTFGEPALAPQWIIERMTRQTGTKKTAREELAGADSMLGKLADKCERFQQDWEVQQRDGLDYDTWFNWVALFIAAGRIEDAWAFSRAAKKHDQQSEQIIKRRIEDPVEQEIAPTRCLTFGCSVEQIEKCFKKVNTNEDGEITNSPAAFLKEKSKPAWLQSTKMGVKFLPGVLARHLVNNERVFYAGETFFAYRGGVYQEISDDEAAAMVKKYLPDNYCKSSWINDAMNLWKLDVLKSTEDLNRDPFIINLKNGLLDAKSGAFRPHDPDFLSIVQLNSSYDESAGCPLFLKFLGEVLPPENILLVQEFYGYCLVPLTLAQKAFVLHGPGQSGKSTVLSVLEYMLGKSNVSNVEWQDLGDRFKTAQLFGKLANIAADLPARAIEDTATFKAIVGEDTITAERKFKNPFSFKPFARLLFSCNRLPYSKDQTGAFYRRLIIIPFENVIPDDKVDKHLKEKLFREVDGIFSWALEGLRRLMANNFTFSENDTTRAQIERYRLENSNVLAFIAENCVVSPKCHVGREKLYQEYKKFCEENGFKYVSQRNFNQEIEANFPAVWRDWAGPKLAREKVWRGIGLLDDQADENPGSLDNTEKDDLWDKL